MGHVATIELDEDEVKEIILKHMKDKGYELVRDKKYMIGDQPITIDVSKGFEGRRGKTMPHLNKVKVKVMI